MWDAAGRISSNKKSKSSLDLSLSLRGKAILLLLPDALCGSTKDNAPPKNDDKTLESVRASLFDSACSAAWKAAVTYTQQLPKSSTSVCSEELEQFHKHVGDKLDRAAEHVTAGSPAYFEYCAYRAIQCGSAFSTGIHSCRPEGCLFQSLPDKFCHSTCARRNNIRCS